MHDLQKVSFDFQKILECWQQFLDGNKMDYNNSLTIKLLRERSCWIQIYFF